MRLVPVSAYSLPEVEKDSEVATIKQANGTMIEAFREKDETSSRYFERFTKSNKSVQWFELVE